MSRDIHEQLTKYIADVAQRAGDRETAATAERILVQERAAAERIEGMLDEAVTVALAAQGVGSPR